MTVSLGYWGLILAWAFISLYFGLVSWSRIRSGIGLLQIYLIVFFAEHWIPGLIYGLPWYEPINDRVASQMGFEQSFIGVTALLIGAVWISPALDPLVHRNTSKSLTKVQPVIERIECSPAIPTFYTIIGFLVYFLLLRFSQNIPTVQSLVSVLIHLTQVGLMALYYYGFKKRHRLLQLSVLAMSLLFPLLTIVQNGQAWFGIWSTIMLVIFTARVGRIPRYFPVLLAVLLYIGLSFFVNYFLVRPEIRQVTWRTPDATLNDRYSSMTRIFDDFELFQITDSVHLFQFDERFNQNSLLGYAIQRFEAGTVDFAYGGTIANALIALIPRIIWPDKPVFAGGSAGLRQYAGISYAEGTTANTGHVMEFYINFGVIGVILGFVTLGIIVAIYDRKAAIALEQQQWMRFGAWTLPALSLLFPENSLVIVVGGVIGGTISIAIINYILKIFLFPAYSSVKNDVASTT